MGEDKKCDKGSCSVTKFFVAILLLGGLAIGGSVAAAKVTGHPEWNLLTRIMTLIGDHKPDSSPKVHEVY